MAHRVAPGVESDLDDIWVYTARESGSMELANRLIDSIANRFLFLAAFPYAGRARDEDFGPGTRSFTVGEYVSSRCVRKTRPRRPVRWSSAQGELDLETLTVSFRKGGNDASHKGK